MTKDGGAAFPVGVASVDGNGRPLTERDVADMSGMSLRDYFAAQVMDRMISLSTDADGGWSADNVARGCYNLADAMLEARKVY